MICKRTDLVNGAVQGYVADLFVHVVSATSGVIAQPDCEVLDLQRLALKDLNVVG